MKTDRTPTLYFEIKTNSYDENEYRKRNKINNVNTIIPKTFEEVMNSENANIWRDALKLI
ncbi:hypothetical protein U3516DRAFT_762549 [Neocallimastix sp. 'constans']|jgi:hypothetical protein